MAALCKPSPRASLAPLALLLLLAFWLPPPWPALAQPAGSFRLPEELRTFANLPKDLTWEAAAPEVREVRILSSADGSLQPALFHDPGSGEARPLLVALHSWSDDYTQKASIPYALWAVRNGWVFIHPDFRGVNDNPDATVSDLALRDILDAVEYAKRNAKVDESRVYLIGFSGGAMSALVLAGKYPDLWTAVSAWVPIHDLNDWYAYNRKHTPWRHYAEHIAASCGGRPSPATQAAGECTRRSPSAHLRGARGKPVRIHIAVGLEDNFVPPSHSLRAFNDLADLEDRFSARDMRHLDRHGRLPGWPSKAAVSAGPVVPAGQDWPKVFERTSGNATLTLFEGRHDIHYQAALDWLSRQAPTRADQAEQTDSRMNRESAARPTG